MKYILVAGTSKGGSTSLYWFLANHPQLDGSIVKQSRFFLDEKWLERGGIPAHHYSSSQNNSFEKYFDPYKTNIKYRVESTPDYLYSEYAAKSIYKTFENDVEIIFILRNPLQRILSWYKFGQQTNIVPKDESLTEFINKCFETNEVHQPAYSVIETNHYSKYLKMWYDIFPKEQIHIYFLEDLERDPKNFMINISNKLGIDNNFYINYKFLKHNKSYKVTNKFLLNLYRLFRRNLIGYYTKSKNISYFIKPIKNIVSKFVKLNSLSELTVLKINDSLQKRILKEYKNESINFEKITGIKYPY